MPTETALLRSDEIVLEGLWLLSEGKVVSDDVSERIGFLVTRSLVKVVADRSGWETLYRDPRDNRLWGLTYPESPQHGGGPPKLVLLPPEVAESKYGVAVGL